MKDYEKELRRAKEFTFEYLMEYEDWDDKNPTEQGMADAMRTLVDELGWGDDFETYKKQDLLVL